MLRAYSYTEHEGLSRELSDKTFVATERTLAEEFVKHNKLELSHAMGTQCPICASEQTELFALFSEVPYLCCLNCWSVFTPVEQNVVDSYRAYMPLAILRKSDEYQSLMSVKRERMWQELCFWVKYRCARYFGVSAKYSILDIGNRYDGFKAKLRSLSDKYSEDSESADVILYLTQIQYDTSPKTVLSKLYSKLNENGLLFLSARTGSGFDLLTLKGANGSIYPYEYATLPSIDGLQSLLKQTGFEVLEITSPGNLDIRYVVDSAEKLSADSLFLRYITEKLDDGALAEFQRFLQKSNISSYSQIVARRKEE
jgi:hypothetical protein